MRLLRLHLGVIYALVIRDLMVRFGRHHLGFFWTVLEPMILTVGVMFVWSAIKEPIVHGIPVITFVLTGYMPLTLWRHMTTPMVRLLRGHAPLLYHRSVSHIDIVVARGLLEFLSTTAALVIIYFVVVALGIVEPIHDFSLTLTAWLLTFWYFGALGFLIATLTETWEPAEKFIPALQYLGLPFSGVFFMLDWIPNYAQKLLLLNPSVHCFEMFRAGFLGGSITTHYDPTYLISICTLLTLIAAVNIYHVREKLQIT